MKSAPLAPSRRRNALSNTAFSVVSIVLTLVTGMLFVPWYLGYVGASAYGAWLASGNVLAWLSIVDPGIGDLSRQRVAEHLGARRWRDVCSTLLCGGLAIIGLAALVMAGGMGFAATFVGFLRLPDAQLSFDVTHAFQIACVGAGLTLVGNFLSGAVQGLQASFALGFVTITIALTVPLVRLGLLYAGFALDSFAWALVFQGLVMCAGGTALLAVAVRRQQRPFVWSLHDFKSLVSLSLFTGLSRIANTISNNISAVLIARTLGPAATVSFEMTRLPIEMSRTLLDKPASGLLPAFAHLQGASETAKMRAYAMRYLRYLFWTLGLAIAGFTSLNRLFVDLWVGDKLFAGPLVNGLLVAGLAASSISNSSRLLLFAFGRIRLTAISSLIETIVYTTTAVVGIQWFGLPGLAAASSLVFLSMGI
jgi:O-antigen/teichoic acid export membrane protein